MRIFTFVTFCFLQLAGAVQEFETVVKDTQFNSSSRVVIDKEEIEKSHATNLTSLLAAQANISIAQSNFTPTTIYLRGGDSSHVLILVDGVPYYDASTIQRTINLNSIDIKSVQKIEVIKGSQSVLYGGQALSGVIKIDTLPTELKNSSQLLAQVGSSNQSSLAGSRLQQIADQSAVALRGSYFQKDASSPVLDSSKKYPTHLGTGELAYVNRNYPLNFLLKAQTSFDKTFIATTATNFKFLDTDNFETSTYQVNTTSYFTLPSHYLKPKLSVSSQKSNRLYEQDIFSGLGMATKREYQGDLLAVRFDLAALDLENVKINLGSQYNLEKFVYIENDILSSDNYTEFEGFFIKSQFLIEKNLDLEIGFRSDFNQMKNKTDTFQLGVTLLQDIKFEYATGFKQPSLYQLFSDYGNVDLEPEKSKSISVSIDHEFSKSFFVSYSVFSTQFDNLIVSRGAPPNIRYENIQSSDTKGHELSLIYRDLFHQTTYNLNLGYQEPYDSSQKTWLVRRPLRTASFKIRQEIEAFGFGLEVIHNGDRRDKTGQSTYGTLSPYTLTNLTADYAPYENLSIFIRVLNITNSRYESSYGFYDEGLNVIAGAQYNF